MGFPIRRSSDQSSFAAPRRLSQRTTSFIASQRQGIHRMPLSRLIALTADAPRHGHKTTTQSSTRKTTCFWVHPLTARCTPPLHASQRTHRKTGQTLSSQCQSTPQTKAQRAQCPQSRIPSNRTDLSQPNLGGARRDRTDDLMLAKHALSQLSYSPDTKVRDTSSNNTSNDRANSQVPDGHPWWAWEDLNFRPHAYQARALTN